MKSWKIFFILGMIIYIFSIGYLTTLNLSLYEKIGFTFVTLGSFFLGASIYLESTENKNKESNKEIKCL